MILTWLLLITACADLRSVAVSTIPQEYTNEVVATERSEGAPFRLVAEITGLEQPTDVIFPAGLEDVAITLEKEGRLRFWSVDKTGSQELARHDFEVLTASEMGLLGIAVHPNFPADPRLYLNLTVEVDGDKTTRVQVHRVDVSTWSLDAGQTLFEVMQPYGNHNGGQVAFGPDGALYIGMGDGGWRADPHDHGQNASTLLGSILRLDIETEGARPEIWATGLRNPWRFSFAPDGRMVVADVGQDKFEEVSIVTKGDNMGWDIREGAHCFPPDKDCLGPATGGFVDPIFEYGRDLGQSITGGHVYTGKQVPALSNRYVFADFLTGRFWALTLPPAGHTGLVEAEELGQWSMLPVAFARSRDGEIHVADYQSGMIYGLRSLE